jgi:hypothetical protein
MLADLEWMARFAIGLEAAVLHTLITHYPAKGTEPARDQDTHPMSK